MDTVTKVTAEEARALLAQDRQTRVEQCKAELEILLARCRCKLVPLTTIQGNQVISQIQIIAE